MNQFFGIPLSLVNQNSPYASEFTVDLICAGIDAPDTSRQMRSEEGAMLEINTSIIDQKYDFLQNKLIEEADVAHVSGANTVHDEESQVLKSEIINEESDNTQFKSSSRLCARTKKCLCKVQFIEEFTYNDVDLIVIKFKERASSQHSIQELTNQLTGGTQVSRQLSRVSNQSQ